MSDQQSQKQITTKVGVVLLGDGKSQPKQMRLKITDQKLILEKEANELQDIVDSFTKENPCTSRERIVTLHRQNVAGLGFSIKGGIENKLPILISRIFKDQAADQTGQLFIGDMILKVNNVLLENATHDDAVTILHNAGEDVTLTVKHYRAATPFLAKTIQKKKNKLSQNDVCIKEVDDSKITKLKEGLPKSEKWVEVMKFDLLMAYLTRYMLDTDKLRPNAFEIHASEGKPNAVIQCEDANMLSEWVKHISSSLLQVLTEHIKQLNTSLPIIDQIVYMGWVSEGVSAPQPWYKWHPRFLVLKGSEVYLFDIPPNSPQDYLVCSNVYKVYQCMFRCLRENEHADQRECCILVQTGPTTSHYLCVETQAELTRIENSWHKAIFHAITRLGSKTFAVLFEGRNCGLTLDWNMGFALYDKDAKCYSWKYKFSQLKSSSDDRKSKLKLVFHNPETSETDTKELICPMLHSLLYCINAFLAAKVVSVDPTFLRNT